MELTLRNNVIIFDKTILTTVVISLMMNSFNSKFIGKTLFYSNSLNHLLKPEWLIQRKYSFKKTSYFKRQLLNVNNKKKLSCIPLLHNKLMWIYENIRD